MKLQLNEIGTVWCASRPTANAGDLTASYIETNGDSVVVDNSVWFVDQNTEVAQSARAYSYLCNNGYEK